MIIEEQNSTCSDDGHGYGIGCVDGALTAVIGLVALVIVILFFGLIFKGFELLRSTGESKSAVGKTVSAIKNKYCPRIDWSSIKKDENNI